MKNDHINQIKRILTNANIDSKIVAASPSSPAEHIQLSSVLDYKERPFEYHIYLESQEDTIGSSDKSVYISILAVLPYKFADASIYELSRYILAINKSIAFPGFGISEPDRSIYYKYLIPFPTGVISPSFLIDFIGTTWLLMDSFGQRLEQVASGALSLHEAT